MSVKVGEMFFELVGRDKAFHRMLDKAESGVKRAGQRMGQFGAMMTRNVTLPLAAAGGAIIKFGGDFDAAMTRSVAIMGNVSDAMRRNMSQAAIDVSTTTSFAANEAAEAYFFLASAGLDAAQAIEALPAVASFAQAGAFDLALATDLLTDAQSALGMASEDAAENLANMTRIGDVLVKANTLANASVQQFASSLTNGVAAAARNAGIEVEEVTAVLAALADQGLKGEAAGTALTGVLTVLPRLASENAAEFAQLGIQVFDAEGNMRTLADIVDDVTRSLSGMSDEEMTAAFAAMGLNRNILDTMKQLMGTSDKIREYEADLRNAAGMMDEVAEKQLKTLQEQVKLLKDRVIAIGLAFYEDWEPSLRSVNESMQEMTQSIRDMDPEMRRATTTIALVAGGVGIAATAISWLIAVGGKLVGAFQAIVSAGGTLVSFLGGPITAALAALAITAVVAFNQIRERGDGFWSWFIDGWRDTGRRAAQAADRMASAVEGFFASMYHSAVASARSLYTGVKSWLVDKWGSIVAGVQAAVNRVKAAFRGLYHAVVGGSYIPDMVTEVKAWMQRLGSDALVDPATAATKEAAESFRRMNEEIKSIIADLGQALRTEQRWARLTGDEWGAMAAEARLLEGAIRKLLETRSWESAEVQALWAHYQMLTRSVYGHEVALEHLADQEQATAQAAEEAANAREQQRQAVRAFIDGEQRALIDTFHEEENQWEQKARSARAMLDLYPELNAELTKLIELYDMWAQKVRDQEVAQKRLNESLQQTLAMAGQWADAMTEEFVRIEVYERNRAEYMAGVLGAEPTVDVEEALDRIPEVERVAEEAGATIWDYISVLGSRSFKALGNSARDVMGTIMGLLERLGVRSNSVFGRLLGAASSFFSVSAGPLGIVGGLVAGIGSILKLADGGTIRTPGPVMVGERGPELLHLPRAATVQPLQAAGAAASAGAGGPLHLTLELDGRAIARGTMPHLSREMRFRGVTR